MKSKLAADGREREETEEEQMEKNQLSPAFRNKHGGTLEQKWHTRSFAGSKNDICIRATITKMPITAVSN